MSVPNLASNPTMRGYFEEKKLGHILERLVVDLGEARPDDVLGYIESWAAKERAKGNSSSVVVSNSTMTMTRSNEEIAQAAWKAAGNAKTDTIAGRFFDVLFMQHASLKRRVFVNVDLEVAKAAFVPLLHKAVMGELDKQQLAALAKEHGSGHGAEAKHFHYFLTAMLTATSIVLGDQQFQPASEGFRLIFTRIGDALMVGLGLRAAADTSSEAASSLKAVWDSVKDKRFVAQKALTILFTQRPHFKKYLLAGVNEDVLAEAMADGLSAQLCDELSDDAIIALGSQHGIGRTVESHHFDSFLTATLTALSVTTSKFDEQREAWRRKLMHIFDLLRQGALSAVRADSSEVPHTQGPGVRGEASVKMEVKEVQAALADRSSFDVVHDSWSQIANKNQVVMAFYAVLLTQHSTLTKGVLKDVDLEDLAEPFIQQLTAFIQGDRPLAELRSMGEKHGRPRGAQMRHLHYFLSAGLTALEISIGEMWPAVAGHWKAVLTTFIEGIGQGCEAVPDTLLTNTHAASLSILPEQPMPAPGDENADGNDGEEKTASKEQTFTDEECIKAVREGWAALGKAGKRGDVTGNFFMILFTQHPTVKRKLFAGLEAKTLATLLEEKLDASITNESFPALPDVTALAKEHVGDRLVEMRHYHYFLSAMLAALAIVVGRDEFPGVSEPWRRVLTHVMKAVMDGAPPMAISPGEQSMAV